MKRHSYGSPFNQTLERLLLRRVGADAMIEDTEASVLAAKLRSRNERQTAFSKLYTGSLFLVIRLACSFGQTRHEVEGLAELGSRRLGTLIANYEPAQNGPYVAFVFRHLYAIVVAAMTILSAIDEQSGLEREQHEALQRIEDVTEDPSCPWDEDLSARAAEALDVSVEKVRRVLRYHRQEPTSLETLPRGQKLWSRPSTDHRIDRTEQLGASDSSEECLWSPDETQEDLAEHLRLRRHLESFMASTLTEREERVLRMRLGWDGPPQILEEVGETFGFTRERARQIEAKALRKLRVPKPDMQRLTAYLGEQEQEEFARRRETKLAEDLWTSLRERQRIRRFGVDELSKRYAPWRGAIGDKRLREVLESSSDVEVRFAFSIRKQDAEALLAIFPPASEPPFELPAGITGRFSKTFYHRLKERALIEEQADGRPRLAHEALAEIAFSVEPHEHWLRFGAWWRELDSHERFLRPGHAWLEDLRARVAADQTAA